CGAELKPVDFLKVAHHGSHNGTPLELLDRLLPVKRKAQAQVLVSTKRQVYGTKNPVPDDSLLKELKSRCHKLVTTEGVAGRGVELSLEGCAAFDTGGNAQAALPLDLPRQGRRPSDFPQSCVRPRPPKRPSAPRSSCTSASARSITVLRSP